MTFKEKMGREGLTTVHAFEIQSAAIIQALTKVTYHIPVEKGSSNKWLGGNSALPKTATVIAYRKRRWSFELERRLHRSWAPASVK